ncbi:RnfABCDGE type electron transport complex subunit D [Christensenellaceae bacterium OttesenSCG-928-M15]|nr:RnfABCDGE type electron transport complex subunit D [Christensenellaceae bacterium OttesenSCG-928-M15]
MALRMSTAPHIRSGETTRRIMADVLIALVPCVIAGVYRFGLSAALLIAVCLFTSVLSEFVWFKLSKRPMRVNDLSALVTGLILALNLPPTTSWWVAAIGCVFAIILVKQLFGGIGDNFVNPAIAARAALLASWPVQMTTFILPLNSATATAVDAVTSATPLSTGSAEYWNLFVGNIPGSIGEISKLMIIVGLLYLLIRKVITPVVPLCMLAGTALMSWILGGDPLAAILSGGVMFGAVFMATDYTTSPMTTKGQVVYAFGAGIIVSIIRKYGAYPEGVTYAILVMNIVTPLIDKYMKPKLFGRPQKEAAAKEA